MNCKNVGLNILLFCLLLVLCNFIYSKWFLEKDLQKHSDIINTIRAVPKDAFIIYLGESSNIMYRIDDLDKRSISSFIGDHYPSLKVADITKPASHSGIYKVLLKQIPKDSKLKTVIVTLNLRSFNAQWIYSNLETPLQKSIVLLKPYPPLFNRFLLSFKAYDIKTDQERQRQIKKNWTESGFKWSPFISYKNVIEWDQAMANKGIFNKNGTLDTFLTPLACSYIKTYAFELDTLTNPRIKDFDEIIELAHQRGWNLVFNLLPENMEQAQQLVGKELVQMIENNVTILKKYYTNRGVILVDNLNLVKDDQFIDRDFTSEHYAEKGRKAVAEKVSNALKKWYSEDYIEPIYNTIPERNLINTCENGVIWNQAQTITTEQAYSGSKSSLFYGENPYSITLEYPISRVPDSLKKKITIEFWLYQNQINSDSKIIIESIKNSEYHHTTYIDFNDQITKKKVWQKFSTTFLLPDSMRNADAIKIFIYNPTIDKKYVDDFQIRFQ